MNTAWKSHERALSKRLGGTRAGPTGKTGSDVLHPIWAIECKERRRPLPREIRDAIAQSVAAARPEQLPLVVWHIVGERHDSDIVMIRLKDFEEWGGKVVDCHE